MDEDDLTDNLHWPARQLDQVSGDGFGNYADHLWRCEECQGYFIGRKPSRKWLTHRMGMIFDLEGVNREINRAHDRAKRMVRSNPCNCEYHGSGSGDFPIQ